MVGGGDRKEPRGALDEAGRGQGDVVVLKTAGGIFYFVSVLHRFEN